MLMGETAQKAARQIRNAALAGFRALGGLKWVGASGWRRQRLLILCYHGVSLQDEHEWAPELFVTPAFLRRRFEILRDSGYVVLPLGEAVQWSSSPLQRPQRAIRMARRSRFPPRS